MGRKMNFPSNFDGKARQAMIRPTSKRRGMETLK